MTTGSRILARVASSMPRNGRLDDADLARLLVTCHEHTPWGPGPAVPHYPDDVLALDSRFAALAAASIAPKRIGDRSPLHPVAMSAELGANVWRHIVELLGAQGVAEFARSEDAPPWLLGLALAAGASSAVAGNPATPSDMAVAAVRCGGPALRAAVLNRAAHPEVIAAVVDGLGGDWEIIDNLPSMVAKHPNCPTGTLAILGERSLQLRTLRPAAGGEIEWRDLTTAVAVAAHPRTPKPTLLALAAYGDESCYRRLARVARANLASRV